MWNPSFHRGSFNSQCIYRRDESERQLRILWQHAIAKKRRLATHHQHLRPLRSPERLIGEGADTSYTK